MKRLAHLGSLLLLLTLTACRRQPPLHLVDREVPVEFETTDVIVDIDALWDYDIDYLWRKEWFYGWDEQDERIFGTWNIQDPHAYNIRRYWTQMDPDGPHTSVLKDFIYGNRFRGRYKLGYYDLLVWNDVITLDGVQSLHFDEESTLEYVTAYTNQSNTHTHVPQHAPAYNQPIRPGYAFYQPEFLFAGDHDNLLVTEDPEDYDYFEDGTWYKLVPMMLTPVTYIYLTQVVLHHNQNRIEGIDGSANITGMARSVNLKSHITSSQDISVTYPVRMKKHLPFTSSDGTTDDNADIVGGRAFTFGLTGTNPYQVTRANYTYNQIALSRIHNYLEVNMIFNNGLDSTFVFNVTDQVREHFKGGVITVELDVDTVPIPTRGGGSGFDAAVQDFEEETHEFEM